MTAAVSPQLAAPDAHHRVLSRALALLASPQRVLLCAVVLAAGSVGFDALSDPDVWWHLRLGQWILAHHAVPGGELFSYTAGGSHLVAHEWLSETLFAVLDSVGGLLLVTLFVGAVCWSGFLAVAMRAARGGAGTLAIAVGIAVGAKAAEPVLGTRPQVFTFALVCWTLWIADSYLRSGGRRVWALPAVLVVWANLHAGFVAGLGVLILVVCAETAKRLTGDRDAATPQRIRQLSMCVGLAALAACVNPLGPALYRYALSVSVSEAQKSIVEWTSPNFHDPGSWALLAVIATFALLPALGGRVDLREGLLAAVGVVMALLAVRYTSICVALALPAWITLAGGAARTVATHRSRAAHSAARAPTALACMAGAAVLAAGATAPVVAVARTLRQTDAAGIASVYPACAASVLAAAPAGQRVFAVYGDAGYLVFRLYPRARVYEYGESASLGVAVFDDYERIAAGSVDAPTALQLLDASHTTAVLYPRGDLTTELDHRRGWVRVLTDPSGPLLYFRGDPSWARGARCTDR